MAKTPSERQDDERQERLEQNARADFVGGACRASDDCVRAEALGRTLDRF